MFRFLLLLFAAGIVVQTNAQQYITAAGIRLAESPGISIQQRVGAKYTMEGIFQAGILNRQSSVSVLLERHQPLLQRDLNLYFGAGPQFVSYKFNPIGKTTSKVYSTAGAAFVGGVELRIKRTLISIDYRPAIRFSGPLLYEGEAGLSVRYVLLQQKRKKHSQATPPWWPFKKQSKKH